MVQDLQQQLQDHEHVDQRWPGCWSHHWSRNRNWWARTDVANVGVGVIDAPECVWFVPYKIYRMSVPHPPRRHLHAGRLAERRPVIRRPLNFVWISFWINDLMDKVTDRCIYVPENQRTVSRSRYWPYSLLFRGFRPLSPLTWIIPSSKQLVGHENVDLHTMQIRERHEYDIILSNKVKLQIVIILSRSNCTTIQPP